MKDENLCEKVKIANLHLRTLPCFLGTIQWLWQGFLPQLLNLFQAPESTSM